MDEDNDLSVPLVVVLDSVLSDMVMICSSLIAVIANLLKFLEIQNNNSIPSSVMLTRLQIEYLTRLIGESDITCYNQLRMDRRSFSILYTLVEQVGGLTRTRNVSIEEMVAMFLSVISHDIKNRPVKFSFIRSGETVSKYFNAVLLAVLRLRRLLLAVPTPITEECTDPKWKFFKVF